MKKIRGLIAAVFCAAMLLGTACNNNGGDTVVKYELKAGALTLPGVIAELESAEAYAGFATQALDAERKQKGYGVAVSPYYTVTAGGVAVPVYCTPMYLPLAGEDNPMGDLHSIATVTVDSLPLSVTVNVKDLGYGSFSVLPERREVAVTKSGSELTATINEYGDFTFIGDGQAQQPLTLFVQKSVKNTAFPDGSTVTHYPKGLHYVERLDLVENQILYLESGAYLMALPASPLESPIIESDSMGKKRYKPFISGEFVNNVKIIGDGAYLDFTNLDWHERDPIKLSYCKNVTVQGVTLVNAPQWNLTTIACEDVVIDNVKIFGYRTNSDGIEIVNGKNTTVKNCFIRSGDDLFGVKSMIAAVTIPGGENILFENNSAWPDKVRGFGVLHETKSDISNVTFRNCNVLFRYPKWMDELGSLAIIVGDSGNISDITFEDIEIYHDVRYPIICAFKKDEFSTQGDYGTIKNIYYKNVRYNTHANTAVRMNAVLTANLGRIENLYFENIYADGVKLTEVSELRLSLNHVDQSKIFLT